ncbi:MAG: hypothetical protein A2X36_13185 [Elusimicrobia bacterium GWA2_69_24]|nr:MAG: hypothetical protein A2X36_13185 [Elusimicrobia bacterium GWA2_69_24]
MVPALRPFLRVSLSFLLAGSALCPSAPAFAAVVQVQGIPASPLPGVGLFPLWTGTAALTAPRLDSPALSPGLGPVIPVINSPQPVAAAPRLSASVAPWAAAPRAAAAARTQTAPAAAAPSAPKAESVRAALVRTGAEFRTAQGPGGRDAGLTLSALYGESAGPRSQGSGPAAVSVAADAPAAPHSRLRAARPAPRGEISFVTPRIARAVDETGANVEYEVGVADLLRESDAESRAALSRQIAREALSTLGLADVSDDRTAPSANGELQRSGDDGPLAVAALADFLRDVPEYRPEGATNVHLDMDGRNHFRLQFERADSSRRILIGQYLGAAFVVMGAVEVSAKGESRQDNPGYWREYAGGGVRSEWVAPTRTEKRGWGPWAHEVELQDVSIFAQSWRAGRWERGTGRAVKTLLVREGRSALGRAEEKLMRAPVVGPLLRVSEAAAQTILTGVLIAPHALAARLAGRGGQGAAVPEAQLFTFRGGGAGRGLDAGGDYAKNPLFRHFKKDGWHVDRLSPAAREALYAKVREERRLALENQPSPLAPELFNRIAQAPIAASEAAATLRTYYGVGTFGRRLIHLGSASRGLKRAALIAAGVLTGAVEGAAESVCNPILWAMLGLGAAATAAEAAVGAGAALGSLPDVPALLSSWRSGGLWFGAALGLGELVTLARGTALSARAAMAGVYALRAAHATLTALWWGPWLFSATDHAGRIVRLTAQGNFDKDYFKQLSKAGTDAIYYFVIP